MHKKETARSTTPKGRTDNLLCWRLGERRERKRSCRFFHGPRAKPKSKAAPADGLKAKPKRKASPAVGYCISAEGSEDEITPYGYSSTAKKMSKNVKSSKNASFDDPTKRYDILD